MSLRVSEPEAVARGHMHLVLEVHSMKYFVWGVHRVMEVHSMKYFVWGVHLHVLDLPAMLSLYLDR